MFDDLYKILLEIPNLDADKIIEELKDNQQKIAETGLCNNIGLQPKEIIGCNPITLSDIDKANKLKEELDKALSEYNHMIQPNISSDFYDCSDICIKQLNDINTSTKEELELLKEELENITLYLCSFYSDLSMFFLSFLISNNKLKNDKLKTFVSDLQKIKPKYSLEAISLYEGIEANIKLLQNNQNISPSEYIEGLESTLQSLVNKQFHKISNSISIKYSENIPVSINKILFIGSGFIKDYIDNSYEPTEIEIESGLYKQKLKDDSIIQFDILNSNSKNVNKELINVCKSLLSVINNKNISNKNDFNLICDNFIIKTKQILEIYEKQTQEYQIELFKESIKNIKCCDSELNNIDIIEPVNDTTNDNIDYNTYSDASKDISKLKYWLKFSSVLNIVALAPQHWAIGIYIIGVPTPLPITWIPIKVISLPVGIIVIFITINGIVVAPVVYMLKFPPLGDSDSYFLTLIKSADVLVKNKTESISKKLGIGKMIGLDIDLDPKLTKNSPYIVDDIPTYERISPLNIMMLKYQNTWCSKAAPYMGL